MKILYNDIDSKACAWITELIKDGQIPDGDVVCKSVTEITPDEIKNYDSRHYFCGIAGWPAALRLAGWPRDLPADSASLPCQSFSAAGKQKGFDDHRGKLWEPFYELVKVRKPKFLFGEQVEAAIGKGWLDRIHDDLEKENYTVGAIVLAASSVGAPHRRYRIYWVASLGDTPSGGIGVQRGASQPGSGGYPDGHGQLGNAGMLGCNEGVERNVSGQEGARGEHGSFVDRSGQSDLMADGEQSGLEGHAGHGDGGSEPGRERAQADGSAAASGPWSDYRIISFKDGKQRRIKRGLKSMAPGLPRGVVPSRYQGLAIDADNTAEARRMRLHGYGNAINLPLAVAFVETVMEEFNITPEV